MHYPAAEHYFQHPQAISPQWLQGSGFEFTPATTPYRIFRTPSPIRGALAVLRHPAGLRLGRSCLPNAAKHGTYCLRTLRSKAAAYGSVISYHLRHCFFPSDFPECPCNSAISYAIISVGEYRLMCLGANRPSRRRKRER